MTISGVLQITVPLIGALFSGCYCNHFLRVKYILIDMGFVFGFNIRIWTIYLRIGFVGN